MDNKMVDDEDKRADRRLRNGDDPAPERLLPNRAQRRNIAKRRGVFKRPGLWGYINTRKNPNQPRRNDQ